MAHAEISILEKYDGALLSWLTNQFCSAFAPEIPAANVQVLIATPDRQFAEVTTKQFVENRKLGVPRISVTRGDPVIDARRHNPVKVRKLAVVDGRSYRTPYFPAPISLPYQVTLWTDKVHQMNRWLEKFLYLFRSGYLIPQLKVHVDATWGDKAFGFFMEGSAVNNSNLQPDDQARLIRYDLNFRLDGWIFETVDLVPDATVPIVKEIEVVIIDDNTQDELDRSYQPKDHGT